MRPLSPLAQSGSKNLGICPKRGETMAKFSKIMCRKIPATYINLNGWNKVFYGGIIIGKGTYLGILGTHGVKKLVKWFMDV